jgi:predicted ATPase
MIRLVEALRYRCLRDVRQEIGDFQLLVGPNASGKSTFLDVIRFLGDLLRGGLTPSVRERSPNFLDLLWMFQGQRCDLAVELEIPEERVR